MWVMKTIVIWIMSLTASSVLAKGLACGSGALSPMEARLEQASGQTDAASSRIDNAKSASAKIAKAAPDARQAGAGKMTVVQKETKTGCCARSGRKGVTVKKVKCCKKKRNCTKPKSIQ